MDEIQLELQFHRLKAQKESLKLNLKLVEAEINKTLGKIEMLREFKERGLKQSSNAPVEG